jgi:hypothetical protein
MAVVQIRESGHLRLTDDLRWQIEKFVEVIPEKVKACLHTVDYASFTSVSGLILYFSPEKIQQEGVTQEEIKRAISENHQKVDIQVTCDFKEPSSELSFNEELRLRQEAIAEEESYS